MLSCTAQGAEWLGTCGQGRHLPCSGGPLGAPRPSTAKRRAVVGTCAPCARPAPAPAPLALWLSILDAGAAEQDEQLLSHRVRRSLQPHSVQLSQGEATAPGLADTILPLGTAFPATPAAPFPSDHHFPTVPCSTCGAGMAPQGLWSRSLLRPAAPGNAVLKMLHPSS